VKNRRGDTETRKHGHGDAETRKNGHGDAETRGHGEKTPGLRVSASGRAGRSAGGRATDDRSARSRVGSASKSPSKSPRLRVSASPRRSSPRPHVSASPRPSRPLITLLTDFGQVDYFVGAMKGVILSLNPQVRLADITHEIPPHDISAAAFTLLAAYDTFPAQTIHLAVVDPGVGSSRRPILVVTENQFFVGPDNGIFSYIIDRKHDARVFHLTNKKYFRQPVSATFHGRDIFAPVAGALSLGVPPENLGVMIEDHQRLAPLAPHSRGDNILGARIIHIDRFGNCITNLTQRELTQKLIKGGTHLVIKGKKITTFRQFFSDRGGGKQELFLVWGSAGFLEIAAQNASAAKVLNVERGERVKVSTK
jgi:S-adenosylmethionine hydrolase